jgi:outer membrane protein TolC
MTMLKQFAAALVAVPMLLGAQTSNEPSRISLDEAIRLAQQNSPAAIQARNSLRTAALDVRQSYMNLFIPSLNANVGISRPLERNQLSGERLWQHNSSLSASVNFLDPRGYWTIGTSKLALQSAEISELQQRYNTTATVKSQYFAALNAAESEAAARASLATAEESFKHAVARVRAGAVITSDSLRAMISLSSARINVLSAQNAARQASAQLTRTIGSEFPVMADPSDTANFQFVTIDSLELVRLVEQGPAMENQRIAIERQRYALRTARWQYLPTLPSLSWSRSGSGVGFYGYDDLPYNYRHSYTTGVSFSIPIWNNLSREQTLMSARMASDLAQVQYRDQRAGQLVSLNQQIGTLRTTQAQIDLAELQLMAAIEDNRVVQLRYQLGQSTQLEASTSQDALTSARQRVVSLRNTYRNARAQLETLIGRDLQ